MVAVQPTLPLRGALREAGEMAQGGHMGMKYKPVDSGLDKSK